MTEKPILFSTEMVRQIFAGNKTQTRRISKRPKLDGHGAMTPRRCPYGPLGKHDDIRLWVRETWQAIHAEIDPETGYADEYQYAQEIPHPQPPGNYWQIVYKAGEVNKREIADWPENREDRGFPWRPGIHMPRWASRLILDVKSIRAERLQEITEKDARAEGFDPSPQPATINDERGQVAIYDPIKWFQTEWDKLNGKRPGKRPGGSWADNPWVWIINFEVSDAS